eukprot:674457-Prorocentrum_minimum.AAC.1
MARSSPRRSKHSNTTPARSANEASEARDARDASDAREACEACRSDFPAGKSTRGFRCTLWCDRLASRLASCPV